MSAPRGPEIADSDRPAAGKWPRVLLTGFDPFGGAELNASWEVARALGSEVIAGHEVVAAQLPTRFADALGRLDELLAEVGPQIVICLGQAHTRAAISLERVAINVEDARIADNAGQQPVDLPVVVGGPVAYFSGLPIKAMARGVQLAEVPAEVSQTAGTFVCNQVFYGLMHRIATQPALARVRGGFVHVPVLPEQVTSREPGPSMPREWMIRGLRAAIEAAITQGEDARLGAGALA